MTAVATILDAYILTGQSLAGGVAEAVSTAVIPFRQAWMLAGGPIFRADSPLNGTLVPLVENRVETLCSAFAEQRLADNDRPLVIIGAAAGGKAYHELKKDGESGVYQHILEQIRLLEGSGYTIRYRALLIVHGETDGYLGTADYDQKLAQWRRNFESDIAQISGRPQNLPLFTCQTASAAGYARAAPNRHQFTTPFAQLRAGLQPMTPLVCPKYAFDYLDHAHPDAASMRLLGRYYARACHAVLDNRENWAGVRPLAVHRIDDHTLEIEFATPVPPLQWDTQHIQDPGHYGFNLYQAGGTEISEISLLPEHNRVRLKSNRPLPSGSRITYAFDNGEANTSGRLHGARGCLRDSADLPNWAFAFEWML